MIYRAIFLTLAISLFPALGIAQGFGPSLPLVYEDGQGGSLNYRLFLPPGHDDPNANLPVVLFLHGSGQVGTDNASHLLFFDGLAAATQSEEFAAFLIAPQVRPDQQFWSPAVRELTFGLIEELEQMYSIDSGRRLITGLSMGGFGTWDFLADAPGYFEAAAPMSAWGDPTQAGSYAQSRIWSFHGRQDNLPAEFNRITVASVSDAGGDPLYTETNGGHVIWDPIYDDRDRDLYPWMFEGVEPSLATFEYNPLDGSVVIDSTRSPGGAVNYFDLGFAPGLLSAPETVSVGAVDVPAEEFFQSISSSRLLFNDRGGPGVSERIGLGPVLPAGLDYLEVLAAFQIQFYQSPATGPRAQRYFSVVVVPEPAALGLVVVGLLMVPLRSRG